MKFARSLWASALSVLNWLTPSQTEVTGQSTGSGQYPVLPKRPHFAIANKPVPESNLLVFVPPSASVEEPIECEYRDTDNNVCERCDKKENEEGCWVICNGKRYDINTDYEKPKSYPPGIKREYTLDASQMTINADGLDRPDAQVFNKQYPGPWIQACWGDIIEVTVINHLPHNGTAVHWHGIRQLESTNMDGVPGISQCPIAYGDQFVYKFRATQDGSSWYHSHYSLQYAAGLLGPITIHGPSSKKYDEAIDPLLITDWDHASAFQALYGAEDTPSILLNGKGDVARYHGEPFDNASIPEIHELHFKPKNHQGPALRYLLRLINTAYDTTFVFSIDNHKIEVIGTDFVPIKAYETTYVTIGIGQRFHVIVTADGMSPDAKNFWVRTYIAGCRTPPSNEEYMKTGILRYVDDNGKPFNTEEPNSKPWSNVNKNCVDEEHTRTKPVVRQDVPDLPPDRGPWHFDIARSLRKAKPYPHANYRLIEDHPLQMDYDNPTFLNVLNPPVQWPNKWVVVPEDHEADQWVYVVITGHLNSAVAHPMHLHGHDFVILQVEHNKMYNGDRSMLRRWGENPARRDVVLVPPRGFVLVAFKADNPGNWLLHCHIAWHASEGLALQIIEQPSEQIKTWPKKSDARIETERVCGKWRDWYVNRGNWDPDSNPFMDDSGI